MSSLTRRMSSTPSMPRSEGSSVIHDVHHLERGYHRPLEAFAQLGLPITRNAPAA